MKLKKNNITYFCQLVKNYMQEGKTIEKFLTDFELSSTEWERYYKKHKKLQKAVDDGLAYYKAYWQEMLNETMFKKRANTSLAKMAFENALGWTELAQKRELTKNKGKIPYRLILDLRKDDDTDLDEKTKKKINKKLMEDNK